MRNQQIFVVFHKTDGYEDRE